MEKEKKSLKFIMVIAMILSMTIYDFIIIGKATISFAEELIKGKAQISCYFKDSNGNSVNSIEATTEEDIYAYFDISVATGGYLTDGQISLENNSFDFDKEIISENIESIDENIIKLKQINGGESQQIKAKINVKKQDIYNLNLLNHETTIKLKGKYNAEKTEEIEAKGSLNVKYICPYTAEQKNLLTAEIITNKIYKIQEQNKRIIQIQLVNNLSNNNYPIKHSKLWLTVPQNVEKVQVYSRGTQMTDGKEESEFVEQQYSYNKENNSLIIDLDNSIQTDENGANNVNWKQKVNDKLIVTFIFEENATLPDNILSRTQIELYDNILGDRESTNLTGEVNITLNNEKDGIIEGNIKTEENKIYKGKIYSGEDRPYKVLTKIDLKQSGIEKELKLQKKENKLQTIELNKETNKKEITNEINAKVVYKGIKLSKQNIIDFLGQYGSIEISNSQKIIATINNELINRIEALETNSQENQEKILNEENYSAKLVNNNLVLTYKENQENLLFTIKNCENQGTLNIYHEEIIKNNNIQREELKRVNNLNEKWEILGGEQTETKEFNANIELLDTVTMAQIKLKNNTLTAGKITEGVELYALLRNNDEKYDLFNNPTLKINIPKEIVNLEITDLKIIYADGLEEESRNIIKKDDGSRDIIIKLKNKQTKHQINVEGILGTVVSIICDMQLDKNTTVNSSEITLDVKNEEDVVYEKGNWNTATLNYIIPKQENTTISTPRRTLSLRSTGAGSETQTNGEEQTGGEEQTNGQQTTQENGNDETQQGQNGQGTEGEPTQSGGEQQGAEGEQTQAGEEQQGTTGEQTQSGQETNSQQEQNPKITVTKTAYTATNESAENKEIREREILKYIIKVKNNTSEEIKNISITDNIPDEVTLVEYDDSWGNGNGYYEREDKKFQGTITSLKANETKTLEYYVRVNKNEQNIGKYVGGTEINTEALATIDGQNTEYKSNKTTNKIIEGKLEVNLAWNNYNQMFLNEDSEFEGYILKVKNLTNEELTDIQVKDYISENLTFTEAYELIPVKYALDIPNIDENGDETELTDMINYVHPEDESKKLPASSYNSQSRVLTWNISKLAKSEEKAILISVKTVKLSTGEYEKEISNYAEAYLNLNGQKNVYKTNEMLVRIVKDNVSVKLNVSAKDTYIREGSEFKYYIKIENLGIRAIENDFKEILPENVIGQSLNYKTNGDVEITGTMEILSSKTIVTSVKLGVGASIEIIVNVKAENISSNGLIVYPIENKVLYGDYESNIVKNIIITKNYINEEEKDTNPNKKISGMVWFDANKDGMRDDKEKGISGITVQLIKKATGKVVGKTSTDSKGKYSFKKVPNGEYVVGFTFDNNTYTLTTYQKNKVSKDRNSDVISSQGMNKKGKSLGLTDSIKINNNNAKHIDMGLIKETKYNLEIKKYVENITVKNIQGTKNYNFKNSEFAKAEIPGKLLNNSRVTIKYKFVIKNNGELPGYATEIKDYLPTDLEFSEKQNLDWNIQGNNLVCTSLSKEKIEVGETKEITLVLTKKMNEANTGIVVNTVEITGIKNELGIDDNNKKDNKSVANVIITVKTGNKILLGIAIISLSLITIGAGIYFIKKKIL